MGNRAATSQRLAEELQQAIDGKLSLVDQRWIANVQTPRTCGKDAGKPLGTGVLSASFPRYLEKSSTYTSSVLSRSHCVKWEAYWFHSLVLSLT